MRGSTVDNRQALVFYSHPITLKGAFLARNSPKSTMTASRRNKISLSFPVLSHVRRTKVWENWSRAYSQSQLNKDNAVLTRTGSIWQSHGDRRWPSGFLLLICSRWQPLYCKHLQENGPEKKEKKKQWLSTCTPSLRKKNRPERRNTWGKHWQRYTVTKCGKREREREREGIKNFSSYSHFLYGRAQRRKFFFFFFFFNATWENMTYPHFQRKQAKHLTQQRARRHLWTANPRCCISPTCDGKMIQWACQTASGVCGYWGVLAASTDR